MKLTKQQEAEIWQVYDTWLTAYLNADVKTYNAYFDDDYHFIGSTVNEEFLNRNDATTFFEQTGEQFAGIMDLRNEIKILEIFNTSIFITHFCDVWFINDKDRTYYGRFRLSSVMQKKNEVWRFIYQHFSMPDSKSDEGETIGFDKVNAENIELKEAIKRRTIELENKNRELEIEAALERVRARSSAMQYSDELGEVIALIFTILDEFDISVNDGVALITFNEASKDLNEWMANPGFGTAMNFHLPYFEHPVLSNLWDAKNRGEDFLIERYSAEESRSFLNHIFEHSDFIHTPQPVKDYCLAAGTYATSIALQKHTAIFINDYSGISLTSSEVDLLKRFSAVFEQTYTRFLDIQKAEAQAREAQIEVALEKVRAQTMGMQASEDLSKVASVMFDQMKQLGGDLFAFGIVLCNKDKETVEQWHSLGNEGMISPFSVPVDLDYIHRYRYDQWKSGEKLFSIEIPEDYIAEHFKLMFELPSVKATMDEIAGQGIDVQVPEWEIDYGASFKHGYLLVSSRKPFKENHIFPQFANVFDQAYTRFLDLQKAEAQAREAQIVASLERIRAATMAMHNSKDLSDVLSSLFDQFDVLQINPSHAVLTLINKEKNTLTFRTTGKNGYQVFAEQEVDLTVVDAWLDTAEKWKKSTPNAVNVNEYPPEVLPDVWEVYKDIISVIPENARPEIKDFPEGLFITEGYCQFGYIGFAHHRKPTDEEKDIVRRMAVEFGTLYQRFLDLQKAEAQAREAQIEAALERVRSRSLVMQKSEELIEVDKVIIEQIKALDIQLFGVGIHICHEHEPVSEAWMGDPAEAGLFGGDQQFPKVIYEHTHDSLSERMYRGWKEGESFLVETIQGASLREHMGYMMTIVPDPAIFENSAPPDFLIYHLAYFAQGFFVFVSTSPCLDEHPVFVRFTKVFEQAYTRFLDLQKAEAQAREAQIEAALERARTQSMLMKHSDEIKSISNVFHEQLLHLGIHSEFSYVWLPDEASQSHQFWASWSEVKAGERSLQSKQITYPLDKSEPYTAACFAAWANPDVILEEFIPPPDIAGFFEVWQELLAGAEKLKAEFFPEGIYYSEAYMRYGCFGINIRRQLSEEEKHILKRFSVEFERAYTRFLDLQKAEAQAKEAQIELSLERIRSQVTAMQESSELLDIVVTMRTEFVNLGHEAHYFWHMRWLPERYDKAMTSGDGTKIGMVMTLPRHIHGDIPLVADWEKTKEPTVVLAMDVEMAVDYVHKMITLGDFEQVDPQAPSLDDVRHIGGLTFIMARTTHGEIGYSLPGVVPDPPQDAVDTLVRFAGVFDLAYKRFEDLKSAEHQHREAQIELALERVRARTMAMQHSEELAETSTEMFSQMQALGMRPWACGFNIFEKDEIAVTQWMSAGDGSLSTPFTTPLTEDPFFIRIYEARQRREELFVMESGGHELEETYKYMFGLPAAKKALGDIMAMGFEMPKFQISHCAFFSQGYLMFITYEPYPEAHDIFRRFAKVFEQTYTRFLDLQKAETQTKEAQIELSLERIRSQVTAMQESSELLDIVVTMRTEFVNLGHEAHYFWHMRWLPERYDKAMTSGDGTKIGMVMTLPRHIHGDIPLVADWEKTKEPTVVLAMDVDTAVEYVHKMITLGDFEQVDPQAPTLDDIRHIGGLTFIMARTTHGEIGYSLPGVVPDPSKDAVDTLVRFAGVFDLAYKRFEDLKSAEHQHREAQIELALERVRARTMAMQHSDELADASRVLDEQVRALGIETWGCAFHIYADNAEGDYEWFSSANGNLPFYKTPREKFFLSFYEKGQRGETFHIEEFAGEDCKAHYDFLKTLPVAGNALKALEESGIPLPDYQIDHIAFFSHGYILFITYEPVPEAHEIFRRFARVFEQTYTRFIDLQKLEAQALRAENDLIAIKAARHKAEEALTELKATQDQLVQQEKLASLGQLTAGIAHEIKNPLNFVNNFSDVSLEMIEEAMEELQQIGENEHAAETAAILADIKSNLAKIHEHGSRADGIVQSMLLHSRGGDGKMEPTPLNPIIKEYVNLAFHGMRASKEPINVDIDLQLDESVGEVPLVAEDFSRVILNLTNNAFDAMREKLTGDGGPETGYVPKLSVRTHQTDSDITIEIEDNGPGIPDEIKDKILQPFFTTKKGTQGTGLGLSITNDIVKAHGGRMDVKSSPGKGTTFTIHLEKKG